MDGSTSSSSALTSRRPRDFRVCYDDNNESNDSSGNTADALQQPWGVAPIDFIYSIETNYSSVSLSLREKDAILTSFSASIIESVYKNACLPQRRKKRRRQSAVSSPSSSLGWSSRRAEILSISPGIGHEWLGECDGISSSNDVNKNESFCNQIHGTVVIAFDGKDYSEFTSVVASDFESVGNVVLSRIQEDMINGNYVDRVNSDMLEFGVAISSMKFIDSNYPDLVAQDAFGYINSNSEYSETNLVRADTVGMTLFSKVAIPIMIVLFLLAMGLCWCAMMSCPTDMFFAKRSSNEEPRNNENEYPRSKDSHNRHCELGDRKGNKNGCMGRNRKSEQKRRKESLRALSLEATLQDLSDAEIIKKRVQNAVRSKSSDNQRHSSTLHARNAQSTRGTNRFLPASVRGRPKSTMGIVHGNSHPSDSETGSSGCSFENHNDIENRAPAGKKVDLMNVDHPERSIYDFLSANLKRNATSKSNVVEVSPAPIPAFNLMDRISSCTSIRNNDCFGNGQELPSPKIRNENNNSTVLRYVVPSVERCNSLMDAEPAAPTVSRKTILSSARSPMSVMGTKKSAAYREYINKKMLQRNKECDKLDHSIPMAIGVKRTFTDGQGRIREMMAL